MMKKKMITLFTFFIFLLAGATAQAVIIDFESLTPGTILNGQVIDGVKFQYIGYGDVQRVYDWGGNNVIIDNLNNALGAEDYFFADNSLPFYFNSMEYGVLTPGTGSYVIHLTVSLFSGSSFVYTLDPSSSGQLLTAANMGIDGVLLNNIRVNLVSGSQSFYYDNVDVTLTPEPATLLLLGFGLIGLAGARRRFKK